jgi:hypothetical protein
MEADPTSSPTTAVDDMKTESDFLAQAQHAKAALKQFVQVTTNPDFENADAIKRGALENLMKHTVRILQSLFSFLLIKVLY